MLNGWKTLSFALVLAVLGVAQQADWINLIGPNNGGLVLGAIGVITALLRMVTTTPAGPVK